MGNNGDSGVKSNEPYVPPEIGFSTDGICLSTPNSIVGHVGVFSSYGHMVVMTAVKASLNEATEILEKLSENSTNRRFWQVKVADLTRAFDYLAGMEVRNFYLAPDPNETGIQAPTLREVLRGVK